MGWAVCVCVGGGGAGEGGGQAPNNFSGGQHSLCSPHPYPQIIDPHLSSMSMRNSKSRSQMYQVERLL